MIKRLSIFIASFSLLGMVAFVVPAHAGTDVFEGVCSKPGADASTVCKAKKLDGQNPLFGPQGVMTAVISIVSIIVGIVALVTILLGGFKFITSGSNPQDVAKAREMIIYAIVGLIIAALAQVIVQFILKRIN